MSADGDIGAGRLRAGAAIALRSWLLVACVRAPRPRSPASRCPCRRRAPRRRRRFRCCATRASTRSSTVPVPLDAAFTDEAGREVRLGQYFGARPVVLVLAVLRVSGALRPGDQRRRPVRSCRSTSPPGKEFDVARREFRSGRDARRWPRPSARRSSRATAGPASAAAIHFLTGRQASIDALTTAVGFRYKYDPAIDQFAHPAVITVLTPEGRVSRYLFGIEFAPRDLKFALMDAAKGSIGTVVDQAVLFCYMYDPETGRYGLAIMTAVRAAGLLTLGGLGAFILVTLRRDRRQDKAASVGRNRYPLDEDAVSPVSSRRVVGRDRGRSALPVHRRGERVLRRARGGAGAWSSRSSSAAGIPTRSAPTSTARSCSS